MLHTYLLEFQSYVNIEKETSKMITLQKYLFSISEYLQSLLNCEFNSIWVLLEWGRVRTFFSLAEKNFCWFSTFSKVTRASERHFSSFGIEFFFWGNEIVYYKWKWNSLWYFEATINSRNNWFFSYWSSYRCLHWILNREKHQTMNKNEENVSLLCFYVCSTLFSCLLEMFFLRFCFPFSIRSLCWPPWDIN